MHIKVEVTQEVDELTKREYSFSLVDSPKRKLVLDTYALTQRDSTRKRKYHVKQGWYRTDSRHNTIKTDDIPLPDEVKAEAQEKLLALFQDIPFDFEIYNR